MTLTLDRGRVQQLTGLIGLSIGSAYVRPVLRFFGEISSNGCRPPVTARVSWWWATVGGCWVQQSPVETLSRLQKTNSQGKGVLIGNGPRKKWMFENISTNWQWHKFATRCNDLRIFKARFKCDLRKLYFTNRIVDAWNSFPIGLLWLTVLTHLNAGKIYIGKTRRFSCTVTGNRKS